MTRRLYASGLGKAFAEIVAPMRAKGIVLAAAPEVAPQPSARERGRAATRGRRARRPARARGSR